MSKLSYKVSYYVLYALFAIILIVLGMFYFSGFDTVVGEYNVPDHTDTLIFLIYGILGFCVVATLVAAVIQFGSALADNPMSALRSLIGIVLLAVLLGVTYSMGSVEPIRTGEGVFADGFWLKITDMFVYSIYILLGITVLCMIGSSVKKAIS
ncbi:MAG: hypothetical protein LUF04_07365 [Bacteroides sp.]|nr:hypothetical protein [Bacteroides sp.]